VVAGLALFALVVLDKELATAQALPVISSGPFFQQDTLVLRGAAVDALGPGLAVVGDTALVAHDGSVSVYERDRTTDLWTLVTELTPSDGAANFGRAIAFDGRRAIVGAAGAAYLFRRQRQDPHGWREVARLVPSDGSANFGAGVAVEGRYAMVGPVGNSQLDVAGSVFVFKRTAGSWSEITRIASPTAHLPSSDLVAALTSAVTRQSLAPVPGR
jgi:hypothetical protein